MGKSRRTWDDLEKYNLNFSTFWIAFTHPLEGYDDSFEEHLRIYALGVIYSTILYCIALYV